MTPLADIHTHTPAPDALLSVEPHDFCPQPGQRYSVGIHPWNTLSLPDNALDTLRRAAQHPQVAAIGETGLDRLRGAGLEHQADIFGAHIDLARQLGKPVIVHCVRAYDLLLDVLKSHSPGVPVVIHGFRGKPQLAARLLGAGCCLSYGERFNPDALRATPLDRLLIETDTSPLPITAIAAAVAAALNISAEQLLGQVRDNLGSVLAI